MHKRHVTEVARVGGKARNGPVLEVSESKGE